MIHVEVYWKVKRTILICSGCCCKKKINNGNLLLIDLEADKSKVKVLADSLLGHISENLNLSKAST
jgi:hypothetical protein